MGSVSHMIQTLKSNAALRGKKKSLKDISKDYKTKEGSYPTFDRKAQQAAARRDSIIFFIAMFIVSICALVAVWYVLGINISLLN